MNQSDATRIAIALEQIGHVLGALYASQLGKVDQIEKAQRLRRCGFSPADIALLLGTTTNAINIALHRARKSQSKSKKK